MRILSYLLTYTAGVLVGFVMTALAQAARRTDESRFDDYEDDFDIFDNCEEEPNDGRE